MENKGKTSLNYPPSMSVGKICSLIGIEVPDEFKRYRNLLLNTNKITGLVKYPAKDAKYRENLKKELNNFKKKYYSQEILAGNDSQMFKYLIDWLFHFRLYGFSHNDYFDYEIYNKSDDEATAFLSQKDRTFVREICNKKEDRHILQNKAEFNKTYQKYVHRAFLDTTNSTFEEFQNFIKKKSRSFWKAYWRNRRSRCRNF